MIKVLVTGCVALSIVLLILIVLWKKYKVKFEQDFAKEHEDVTKFLTYYDLYVRWIELKLEAKQIVDYFNEHEYKKVVVYGMKEAGALLYKELQNTELDLLIAMDKAPERLNLDLDIRRLDEGIPEVDVIVVTPVRYFDTINEELKGYTNADIVSIEDVIWGI